MKKKILLLVGIFTVLFECNLIAQPPNDNVCAAEYVAIGSSVYGSCDLATNESGEPSPSTDPMDCITNWCDLGLDGSVWYYFTAPPSGNVVISSCTPNNMADTQFALYLTGNCGDFPTYSFVAINDDCPSGCTEGIGSYSSEIAVCGLMPGQDYYLQVDGYNGDPSPFEITFTESVVCPLFANVQFVHSSPDASVSSIDIRINNVLVADNLNYGEATPMIHIDNVTNAYWTINPSNSMDDSNPYFGLQLSLPMQSNFVIPIVGINDIMSYDISETGAGFGFIGIQIDTVPANANNQYISFFNTVTDHDGFRYMFDGVDAYGPLGYGGSLADEYLLTNHPFDLYAMTNPTHYAHFEIPFEDYVGESISILTSGFVDPAANSNGPELTMCVVKRDGTVDCYEDLLGLQELSTGLDLNLSPNPANELLKLSFLSESSALANIEITDVTGNRVHTMEIPVTQGQNQTSISLSNLASGTYYVRMVQDGVSSTPKPIVVAH